MRTSFATLRTALAYLALLVAAAQVSAGVLPEDRADVLYHRYQGGGVTVDGPSILVRKKFGESVAATANYFVDMVTSASIDVRTSGASQYKDRRTQWSEGVEYLRGKTTYSLNYINSVESDYVARTASVGVSEDMFGDLTTVSLGYSRAWDRVGKNVKINGVLQPDFAFETGTADHRKPADHWDYRVGLSQILTKHFILGLNYESQTSEGYLQNPYRSIRFLQSNGSVGAASEIYPSTRTTNAFALDARYYLPYRAALHGSYRFFTDTWGIRAHTVEIGYTQPWHSNWIFEGSYRYHKQRQADFYSDLFPRANFQNFMARDRNLSTMHDQALHLGITYQMDGPWSWLQKSSANLFYDRLQLNYDNFRDATGPGGPGNEPLYSESANVLQFFLSVYF